MKYCILKLFLLVYGLSSILYIAGCEKHEELLIDYDINISQIVAHAGYWKRPEGGAPNTIESYVAAIEAGINRAETDIRQTADGVLVLVHDEIYNDMNVAKSNASSLQLPTLEELLKIIKQYPDFVLLIEIKEANVYNIVELCRQYNMLSQVEFMSFSTLFCQQLIDMNLGLKVAYLGGDISPTELKNKGYMGIAYHYTIYNQHPEYIGECNCLGMNTYVWTVDNRKDIMYYINAGVNFIITNSPI